MNSNWKPLSLSPETLVEARVQLHWAAQLAGASADALMERAEDDSHTNLHWDEASSSLLSNALVDEYRVALELSSFSLCIRRGSSSVAQLPLAGQTLAGAFTWLAEAFNKELGGELVLTRRDYEMPAHPVSGQASFSGDMEEPLAELGRHYANADVALKALAKTDSRATPVAIWPHHFDMGGILILDPDKPFEEAPQIGFGMSPGDGQIPEPYYYVTPWPLPEGAALPELMGGGQWESKAFTGALLLSSYIIALDAAAQEECVSQFLSSALSASLELLDSA